MWASCVRPTRRVLGGGLLAAFAACNFRMSEFTGAVLKGQLTKLETICKNVRANARKVREGIADLPGLKLRKSPDVDGDFGQTVFLEFATGERRDNFLRALRAEGIGASGPGGSAILPTDPRIETETHDSSRLALVLESRGTRRSSTAAPAARARSTSWTARAA